MAADSSPQKKCEVIADRLQHDLRENPSVDLPAIAQLARQYDVAYQTMFDAVHILERKGLVRCHRGRKTVRTSQAGGDVGPEHALLRTLREDILQGVYRSGEVLPKIQFLVKTQRVATHTVVKAYQRLQTERLAHKRGKNWVAGPPDPAPAPRSGSLQGSHPAPVILFLTISERHWSDFYNTAHTIHFASSFNGEIARFGLQLSLVLGEKQETATLAVPVGFDEIHAYIRNLGDRFRGVLIAFNRKVKDALSAWIGEFAAYRKPVVYFDFNNDGADVVSPESLLRSLYFRLHLDEQTAIRLILDELLRNGHRVIGVPAIPPTPAFKWAAPRVDLIRETAATLTPRPEVIVSYLDEDFWEFPRTNNIRQFIDNFDRYLSATRPGASGVVNRPDTLRRTLIDQTPSLMSLLDRKVTAMIGLNDAIQRELYFWARSIGLKIPQQLSLAGMDNKAESIVFPLSTVDFGFPHLGYLAAHIFIGDIRVRPDARRNIPGPCRLIDRGSIGPAA